MTWDVGTSPWARVQDTTGKRRSDGGMLCYFCGERTVMISFGDLPEDTGRLRLYCDNTQCGAREFTVLVERDGADAVMRADVRALRALDEKPGAKATILARRKDARTFTLEVPGRDSS